MVVGIDELARDIRVCLDEDNVSEALLNAGDRDALSVDDIIRSKIEESAMLVELAAPAELLETGHAIDGGVAWGEGFSGSVLLPDDFMRLTAFMMSDWSRPVTETTSPGEPLYALQRQPVKSLRGTPERPVAAVVNRPEGPTLEFWSCRSEGAYISRGQYIPRPVIDRSEHIDICGKCRRAIVYMAAALALTSLGEAEKAAAFQRAAEQMIKA